MEGLELEQAQEAYAQELITFKAAALPNPNQTLAPPTTAAAAAGTATASTGGAPAAKAGGDGVATAPAAAAAGQQGDLYALFRARLRMLPVLVRQWQAEGPPDGPAAAAAAAVGAAPLASQQVRRPGEVTCGAGHCPATRPAEHASPGAMCALGGPHAILLPSAPLNPALHALGVFACHPTAALLHCMGPHPHPGPCLSTPSSSQAILSLLQRALPPEELAPARVAPADAQHLAAMLCLDAGVAAAPLDVLLAELDACREATKKVGAEAACPLSRPPPPRNAALLLPNTPEAVSPKPWRHGVRRRRALRGCWRRPRGARSWTRRWAALSWRWRPWPRRWPTARAQR